MVLPRLTVLDERYAIGRALDATEPLVFAYQAWNLHTEDQVILEEFFPAPLVHRLEGSPAVEVVEAAHAELFRYGRDQFLKETVVLAALNHPNLVDARECFEAHNTAYRVLAHHKGATLASVLAKQGGKLPVKTACSILLPLLDGLQAAHQRGLIHGAFSPKAIFLAKGRGPMLRGFRTTHVMMAHQTGDWQHLITDGVSAPEQYESGGRQGPWTDVYGSAATLFQMLTGQTLPAAPRRLEGDEAPALLKKAGGVPGAVRHLLEQALSLDSAWRPRSAQSFQQQLLEAAKQSARAQAPASRPAAQAPETPAPDSEPEAKPIEAPVAAPKAVPAVATKTEAPVAAEEDAATPKAAAKPVTAAPAKEKAPAALRAEEAAPKKQAPKPRKPVALGKEREDRAAQEMAAQATKKQAAQKMVVEQLTAQKQAVDEEAKPRRKGRPPKKRQSTDHEAVRSRRRGMPVLAALAVVVLVALSGAYVLMQGASSELTQFAHYKAQGDSLFAVANYMEAKTQYEYALATAPNNEYVTGRLTETEQRLIEVRDVRYNEYLAKGDGLFDTADSLLKNGDALGALSSFAEANKAYYDALRYRPDDPVVLEKGQRTSLKLEEALNQNKQRTREGPDAGRVMPRDMRQQLYNSYRKQGDQLFALGDYAGARAKYLQAQKELPNNLYVAAKLQEVDERLAVTGRDEEFDQFLQKGNALLDDERYAEAQIAFRQALDVKPDHQQALDGLNRAESMLDQAKRDEHYQQFRDQGDALYEQRQHDEALARYEQALSNKPGDAYVEQKVREVRQILEAQRPAPQPEPPPEAAGSEDDVYTVVDEAPELIGGLKELHSRVEYPDRARRMGTEGRVYVQFVVTEDGQVQDAKAIRGIGDGCDAEAVRVVKEAQFVPGKLQGQPVKVWHTLFITFKLK